MEALAIPQEVVNVQVPEITGAHRSGRILVAEDDVHMRRLIARALRAAGYRVLEASDGAEVLERIESTIWGDRHDIVGAIVADMNMPALTGLDVLAALRCADVDTPFILITAFGDAGVRAEARLLGADAVLDKPFDLGQLQRAVRRALDGTNTHRSGRQEPSVIRLGWRAERRPH